MQHLLDNMTSFSTAILYHEHDIAQHIHHCASCRSGLDCPFIGLLLDQYSETATNFAILFNTEVGHA